MKLSKMLYALLLLTSTNFVLAKLQEEVQANNSRYESKREEARREALAAHPNPEVRKAGMSVPTSEPATSEEAPAVSKRRTGKPLTRQTVSKKGKSKRTVRA